MVNVPSSMDELVYFTKRTLGDGRVMAWAYRGMCPECKKGLMGKPKDPKTGKPKIRAKEYVCPECNYTVEKSDYEKTLEVEIKYTCPECKNESEVAIPFKRKNVQLVDEETGKKKAAQAFVANCDKCNAKIVIAKKMKGE